MNKNVKKLLEKLEVEGKLKVWHDFKWPEPFDNGLRLKDFLEDEVEEKYYIDNERTSILLNNLKEQELLNGERFGADSTINDTKKREISNCITARYDAGIQNQKQIGLVVAEPIIVASRGRNPNNPSDRTVGSPTEQRLEPNSQGIANTLTTVQKDNLVLEPNNLKLFTNLEGGKWDKIHESARRVYDGEGIAPTIPTCGGGNIEPKVAVREATKKGYAIATVGDSINLEQPNSKTRRGRVGKEVAQTLTTSCNQATLVKKTNLNDLKTHKRQNIYEEVFGTLGTNCGSSTSAGGGSVIDKDYRIRKLTPKECWRLMGFADEDYFKARAALEDKFYNGKDRSNSQMYKMAGNSIVTNVLAEIFIKLLGGYINE